MARKQIVILVHIPKLYVFLDAIYFFYKNAIG